MKFVLELNSGMKNGVGFRSEGNGTMFPVKIFLSGAMGAENEFEVVPLVGEFCKYLSHNNETAWQEPTIHGVHSIDPDAVDLWEHEGNERVFSHPSITGVMDIYQVTDANMFWAGVLADSISTDGFDISLYSYFKLFDFLIYEIETYENLHEIIRNLRQINNEWQELSPNDVFAHFEVTPLCGVDSMAQAVELLINNGYTNQWIYISSDTLLAKLPTE